VRGAGYWSVCREAPVPKDKDRPPMAIEALLLVILVAALLGGVLYAATH
jgi:hypothetical protein